MTAIGLVAGSHCGPGYAEVLRGNGADYVADSYADLARWMERTIGSV